MIPAYSVVLEQPFGSSMQRNLKAAHPKINSVEGVRRGSGRSPSAGRPAPAPPAMGKRARAQNRCPQWTPDRSSRSARIRGGPTPRAETRGRIGGPAEPAGGGHPRRRVPQRCPWRKKWGHCKGGRHTHSCVGSKLLQKRCKLQKSDAVVLLAPAINAVQLGGDVCRRGGGDCAVGKAKF